MRERAREPVMEGGREYIRASPSQEYVGNIDKMYLLHAGRKNRIVTAFKHFLPVTLLI